MNTTFEQTAGGPDSPLAIEWLSTSILHDLRNPLGTIYAASEMLMDLESESTQVKRLSTNIYRAAGRIRELLTDLSKAAHGNRLAIEICDIREMVAIALKEALAATPIHQVEILTDVPEGLELPLIRPCMQSVFLNLIVNALEAMPNGGKLSIRGRKAGDYARIEVEDSGPGIPEAIRERLFEPFTTTGKRHGLGLGLALCRQSVLSHGGDIWLEPAAGARFVVRIPASQARAPITTNRPC